jgi:hypothetical protein
MIVRAPVGTRAIPVYVKYLKYITRQVEKKEKIGYLTAWPQFEKGTPRKKKKALSRWGRKCM